MFNRKKRTSPYPPLLLFITLYLWHGYGCSKQSPNKTPSESKDGAYVQYAIVGIASCNDKCLRLIRCKSYDYYPQSLTCVLFTSDVGKYKKKGTGGACSRMSCSRTSVCLQNHGKPRCVQGMYLCGYAPVLPHTKKKDTTGYYRGAVATYTCKPRYSPCLKKLSIRCQSDGKWRQVPHMCELFKWQNMELNVKPRIPCGANSRFILTVVATPTNRTRFNINVKAENDSLLIVSFVLNFWGFTNRLGINSQINGKYEKGFHVPLKMKVGRKIKCIISYDNGKFTVRTDGSRKPVRSKSRSTVHPQFAEVDSDATVRLLKFTI